MIDKFLKQWLQTDSNQADIRALAPGGSWPIMAPPRTTGAGPYIVWQVISESKVESLKGLSGLTRSMVSITAFSRNYLDAKAIIAAIVGTKSQPKLIGYTGTFTDGTSTWAVQAVRHSDQRDLPSDPKLGEGQGGLGVQLDVDVWWADRTTVDLSLTMTASSSTPTINSNVTFTITVTNNSNDPPNATGVIVNSLLPAGLNYVSHYTDWGTYSNVSGDWTIGTIGPTSNRFIQIVAQAAVLPPVVHSAVIGVVSPPNRGSPSSASITIDAHV